MKRRLFITLLLAAVISCTGYGKDIVGQSDVLPSASTAKITSGTAKVQSETTSTTKAAASATTSAANIETTATTTAETPTQAPTAAQSNEAAPAGGGAAAQQPAQQQEQPQQSAPAPSYTPSNTTAPSPNDSNYGAAPTVYNYDGMTYIQGVLIANKSYSLPAGFAPGLDQTCLNQFYKLQNAASQQGLNIWLSSGYRSYDYQAQIYNNYVARDGQAAADTYSARPGYSEHQTGLAIDVNQIDDSFIGTPEAVWLENHCHEYGFILRYPQGKQDITGYKYESWHIRYVGTDMSYAIHNSGLTLEEYFGIDSYYH